MVTTPQPIRLYIAEEQALFREAFYAFFVSHPRFHLCGVSSDTSSTTLCAAVESLTPQVVLLGLKRLTSASVQALQDMHACSSEVGVVLLVGFHDPQALTTLRTCALSAHRGYAVLFKSTLNSVEEVSQAVLSVAEGRVVLDPAILEVFITPDTSSPFLNGFSPREQEILSFMAQGYSNKGIAQALFLDTKTVEHHINSIYSKVGEMPKAVHPRVYVVVKYLQAKGTHHRMMDTAPLEPRQRHPPLSSPSQRGAPRTEPYPCTTRLAYPTTPSRSPLVSPEVA